MTDFQRIAGRIIEIDGIVAGRLEIRTFDI
jgi:hypothetical protein